MLFDSDDDSGLSDDYDADSPWIQGKEAYYAARAGVVTDNPYPPDSVAYVDWQGGWNDARVEEELGQVQ